MIEWREAELNDVCYKITDGSHQSPKDCSGGFSMFSVKDMESYGFNYSKVKTISEDDFNFLVKQGCKPNINDILIAKDGSVLKHIFRVKDEPNYVLLSSIAILRPKTEIINPDYLVYTIKSPVVNDLILSNFVSGSGVPRIVLKDFKKVQISFPPLQEQERIAEVLSSLEDKIDLLHRNNKTLEQLAETLFRQWFVEEENNQDILGKVIKTTSGGTPSRSNENYYKGIIPWVKSKELNNSFIISTEEYISEEGLKNSSAKLLKPFTVLIAMYGATVGEIGIIEQPCTCNQAICAIEPSEKYPFTFIYQYFKSIKNDLINLAVGGAQQNVSQDLIKGLEIPIASDKILKYHNSVFPFYSKILNNVKQIQQLETLRDTLLPKLMSGLVRVD